MNRKFILSLIPIFIFLIFPITGNRLLSGSRIQRNAIYYNKEGWNALKKGNTFDAILHFKNAIHKNPRYQESLIGLGTAYNRIEANDRAYDLFLQALNIDKRSTPAMVGLGKTLTSMGQYKEALKYLNKAVQLSEDNINAKFGIAHLYYTIGKIIWSKRTLKSILRINPYHIDSLLLMGEIQSENNRLKQARFYIEKAIDADNTSPRGYIKYAEILYHEYLLNENSDYLEEALDSLKNALAIQPENYQANKILGYINFTTGNPNEAINNFTKALINIQNPIVLYSRAIAYDSLNMENEALADFLRATKNASNDNILRSRFINFLVFRDIKIGHPARIMLSKEQFNLAQKSERSNLPDRTIMYLRKTLLLNPLNTAAREKLIDYYRVENYYRFYFDELKKLLRFFPGEKYQNLLNIAIIKRRKLLYFNEGYSANLPPRDVPVVLVLNFNPGGKISSHPDSGEVVASNISFLLKQFGRLKSISIRKRRIIDCGIKCGGEHIAENLELIRNKIKSGELEPIDFILYGNYTENNNSLSISCRLMDYHQGFNIGEFSLSESGHESLPYLSLRTARRIYKMIPFSGRVLKTKEQGIIVNLGLFDGIKPGSKLIIYKFSKRNYHSNQLKKKFIFTVKEANTLISYAEPQNKEVLELIDSRDIVLPLKIHRAKKIK